MFKSDRPIESVPEDLLSRAEFASTFARTLLEYKDSHSLCVGMFGPWGSGKTSLVNLIVKKIENAAVSFPEEEKPLVLRFNPWNFTSRDQLLKQYFNMLADVFKGSKDKALADIGDLLNTYGEDLESIPKYGIFIAKGSRFAGRFLKKLSLHGTDLFSQRKRIIDTLSEQKRKIIVTIDDIDRLTNEEIQLIFKLVSAVANFPETIFLLSFDREIVVNALKDFHGDDGNKYLEKIVQVAVSVPPASEVQLQDIFASYFGSLIRQYRSMIFDQKYWREMSKHVFPMISNVRDIIRLYNTLYLKLNMIGDEINFVDIVMITLLEMKHPRFYEWIRNHEMQLTQANSYFAYSINSVNSANTSKEIKSKFEKEFKEIEPGISSDECSELLSLMFPVFGSAIGNASPYSDNRELIKDQRIGHYEKFSRYFIYSIGANKIPRNLVNSAANNYSTDQLEKFIKDAVKTYSSSDLITELDALMNDLDKERKEILAKALIPSIKHLNSPLPGELYYLSAKGKAEYLIVAIMEQLGDEKSFYIMTDAIHTACADDLEGISYILDMMLISYNRIRENHGYPQVVSEEHLDKIGEVYAKRVFQLDQQQNLFEIDQSLYYNVLKYFGDGSSYKRYVKNKLDESDLNKLLYLSHTIEKWYSTDGAEYRDSGAKERERFVTNGDMDIVIQNSVKNGLIKRLTEEQGLRVAAYDILRHMANPISSLLGIDEEKCRSKLKEWGYYD